MPVQKITFTDGFGNVVTDNKWLMPDGMSEEIPKELNMDGCLSLLARMYKEEVRELKVLYSIRKRKRYKSMGDKMNILHEIKIHEKWFRDDPYGSGIDGSIPIEECRKEIYGPNWRNHPDFYAPDTDRPDKRGTKR